MRSWTVLAVLATFLAMGHTALVPWIPLGPWWYRAPDKDIPPSVNIQQLGGSYVYNTAEGKAYQAVVPVPPATFVQPPIPVQVQKVPTVALHYTPAGQGYLVPANSVPQESSSEKETTSPPESPADGPQEETATETNDERRDWNDDGNNNGSTEPPRRDPAPVSEEPEENETESFFES
ncbi:uncharacterized protein LOC129738661 [Uranotaenia lowii]|uniref:uncharacterized protein LOC129738661 n=1 Tax=Uranotaenia lowii TaxID=190385 RepID=UPI0024787C0A|nr:uncharacterized protein LOC129738661 [Uranotaenia lowii]